MPSAEPAGLRYERLQERGPAGAWRPLVGVALLVALFAVGQVVLVNLVALALSIGGDSSAEVSDKLSGEVATPSYLAVVNLSWAVAIPAVLLVAWLVHRMAPGWVVSVAGRLRWRWLLVCALLAALALGLTVLVSAVLPDQGSGSLDTGGGLNPWTSAVRDFVLVVVLLTPLQAAGEEFVFRGYLTQVCGGITGALGPVVRGTVAVVVPALLFGLAHGLGQNLPIFLDRFAFGLVAGVLVLLTGGLEAGIAMHVLNNFVAFGLALAFGDMTEALTPGDGTWWALPVTLTQSLSFLALVAWAARRGRIARRTEGGILEAHGARV